jgi:hypothetical protein
MNVRNSPRIPNARNTAQACVFVKSGVKPDKAGIHGRNVRLGNYAGDERRVRGIA